MDRHFTVSIFIVHKDRLLLHLHKKANLMLPLGGHIEANELPEEACIRESKEESGLEINLYNPSDEKLNSLCEIDDEKLLVNPMYTIMGEISSGHHHIDFVYYATSNTYEVNPYDGESDVLKWYTREELKKEENIQQNTREMAIRALDTLAC